MRKITALSILALAATFIFAPTNLQAGEVNITINGVPFDFGDHPPAISPFGHTNVSMYSDIFEHLGLTKYESTRDAPPAIYLRRNDTGQGFWFFTYTGSGQTVVLLRRVAEFAGYFVGWDATTSTVIINSEIFEGQLTPHPLIDGIIAIGGARHSIYRTELDFIHGREHRDEHIQQLAAALHGRAGKHRNNKHKYHRPIAPGRACDPKNHKYICQPH